jgi:hypothetical protein
MVVVYVMVAMQMIWVVAVLSLDLQAVIMFVTQL